MPDESRDLRTEEHLPKRIGRYRIVRKIAEGGMGAVYEAEQENPRRTVALKVIRPGLASPELLRRFAHEAQILARLQHPGIAQIFEAGQSETAAGVQPWFAMELVDGETLTRFAETHALDVRARIELMIKVCDAVHHAHQKGVIHRDLKPGNILVDATGQPKVLDFGVARATDADVQQVTQRTDVGQLLGTLAYMSPEQAGADVLELDVRSDVYSLGVVLYELLAGELPYDVSRKLLHEAVRIIREVEPTTLGTKHRRLRGDLEVIVGKALEKERERRYASAQELAADLGRHLHDEPIVARPASAAYQIKKFAQRNRTLVGAVAAVFAALVAGVVVSVRFAMTAHDAEKLAEQRWRDEQAAKLLAVQHQREAQEALRDSDTSAAFLWDLFARSEPEISGVKDMTVRRLLVEACSILDDPDREPTPRVEGFLRQSIGAALDAHSEQALAEKQARRALELALAADPRDDDRVASCRSLLGTVLVHRGAYAEAESFLREAESYRLAKRGEDDVELARTRVMLGDVCYNLNRRDEAMRLQLAALATRRAHLDPDAVDVVSSLLSVGFLEWQNGDFEASLARAEEAEKLLEQGGRLEGPTHFRVLMSTARVHESLQKNEEARGEFEHALEIARAFYGSNHTHIADALDGLAHVSITLHRLDEAERAATESLAIRKKLLGEHRDTATILADLAMIHSLTGRVEEALREDEEALAMRRKIFGEESPAIGDSLRRIAERLGQLGRVDDAVRLYREARASWIASLGSDHLDVASVELDLEKLLRANGRGDDAIAIGRECLERRVRIKGDVNRWTMEARDELVITMLAAEKWEQARALCEQELSLYGEKLRAGHPVLAYTRLQLARALAGVGRNDEAMELAVPAWNEVKDVKGLLRETRVNGLTWLCAIHASAGREGEAAEYRAELDELAR